MRAAVVLEAGRPPVLDEHPAPEWAPGHTLVRVSAAPLMPLDLLCASGTSYFGRPATPYVPGVQGVGVVERSDTISPGARVWFATSAGMAPGDGALAELACRPDDDVVPVDGPVADDALAALGLSAVAAWMSLTWRAALQPGERLLVLGAGGAVGQAAVGAGRVLGASQVVAVCRSPEARRRASDAGADVVVEHVDDADELTTRLRAAVDGPVDVVVDPVFGAAATAATRLLGDFGRLVTLGGSAGDSAAFSSAMLRSRSLAVLGYTNNAISTEQRAAAITAIAALAGEGRLAVAHHTVDLADIDRAWRATGTGGPRHVLTP